MCVLKFFGGLLCIMVMASGCYHIGYTTGAPPSSFTKESWHHNGVMGLVEFSDPVHLGDICPNGVSKIENWVSFENVLAQALTNSLYNPTTVRTTCAQQAERAS